MKRTAICMAALAAVACSGGQKGQGLDVVVGTYGESLYRYSFDSQTLEFTLKGQAEALNASYALAEGGSIFAVSETGEGSGIYSFAENTAENTAENNAEDTAEDSAVKIGKTAELRQTGADPCFILLYEGRYMMTADYSGGSISVFPVCEGRIGERAEQVRFEGCGPVSERQASSHIHQLREVPGAEGYVLASDLGADVIRLVRICEADGSMKLEHVKDIPCPAGSGPRHMEFSLDGGMLYCIAELSGEVLAYEITAAEGAPEFTLVQRLQADEVNAGGSADIHIHPSGKWIYTSHRLDNDGISVFAVREDGTLDKIGYARTARHPRNFMITPDGGHLLAACRDDRVIQVFAIEEDGTLTLTPSVLKFESDMPSSITACRK